MTNNQNNQAWTFLVSRNQYLDYRTVIAPDFIIEADCGNLLARAVPGDKLTEPGKALCREIHNLIGIEDVTDLTIVFQVVHKDEKQFGIGEKEFVADLHSRPILFLQGIILKGNREKEITDNKLLIEDENFQEYVNKDIQKNFSSFWDSKDFNKPIHSTVFELKVFELKKDVEQSDSLTIEFLEPYTVASQSLNPSIQLSSIEAERDKAVEEFEESKKNFSTPSDHGNWEVLHQLPHDAEVSSIAFSPCGKFIACRTDKQKIIIWDCEKHDRIETLDGESIGVTSIQGSVAFSTDGRGIVSGLIESGRDIIRLWKWENTPGEEKILRAGKDINYKLFKFDLKGFLNQKAKSLKAVFSPYGKCLFCGGINKSIKIFNVDSFDKPLDYKDREIVSEEGNIVSFDVTKQDEHIIIAGGCASGKILLWTTKIKLLDENTGKILNIDKPILEKTLEYPSTTPEKRNQPVNSVVFSPDGQTLASSTDNNTIILWDVSDPQEAKQIKVLDKHSRTINSIAFHPDGVILASGSDDKSIKIWDTQSDKAKEPLTLTKHSDTVNSVAFSPDGKFLASGSNDKTVTFWRRKN